MVAYSFKAIFAPKILAGTKRQTIRAPRLGRSRHAFPGEELQLYTGMRTNQCRLIARVTCEDVCHITIDFGLGIISYGGVTLISNLKINDFARLDGFNDWSFMKEFWRHEHGAINEFNGMLITWKPLG